MISCIIPVYRAANTLAECLDSLLASTGADFELLVILNGEDDGSAGIAEAYAERDDRVRVLRSALGQSIARNVGIFAAKGEYICFCDSDDTVEPDWMEVMLRNMRAHHAELSACSYEELWYDDMVRVSKKQYYHHMREGKLSCGEYLLEMNSPYAAGFAFLPILCNKMFCSGVIRENQIAFLEGYSYTEDFNFVFRYLAFCDTIALDNRHLYHYHHRKASSVMQRYYPDVLDIYSGHLELCLAVAEQKLDLDKRAFVHQPMGSLCVGGMVRICRVDATMQDDDIKRSLAAFIRQSAVRRVMEDYRPGPGQSREIPVLALSGDIDALFLCCREKSKERFGV